MRKVLISLAAAASAITVAAPASAQVTWQIPTYRYAPYNYNYRYSGVAFAQQMQQRVQRIRYDIRNMESRRILSNREARRLDNDARSIERRIYRAPRGGVRPAEARGIENRIRNLEIRIAREASDWDRRARRYRR
jgi:hypothetical protein